MWRFIKISIIVVMASSFSCKQKNKAFNDHNSSNSNTIYQLVWNHEFNVEGLPNATKWKYDYVRVYQKKD